jgi:hypothetical protein
LNYRKRDDLEQGYLYRVVQRAAGSDDEWVHSSYGHQGKPRTYMTLGAARGMKTRMEGANQSHRAFNGRYFESEAGLEFAVQRSPVQNWEIIPDE